MNNVTLQPVGCDTGTQLGTALILSADSYDLAVIQLGEHKLRLYSNSLACHVDAGKLRLALESLRCAQTTVTPRVTKMLDPKNVECWVVEMYIPDPIVTSHFSDCLLLVDSSLTCIAQAVFYSEKQATGIASNVMEALFGGPIDWSKVGSLDFIWEHRA